MNSQSESNAKSDSRAPDRRHESDNARSEIIGVRRTFDRIAPHFSETRQQAWPAVADFIHLTRGRVGLDLGCGNGRHAELLAERVEHVIGVDLSRNALFEARERAADRDFDIDLLQASATDIPVRDQQIDVTTYIATIHHLPSRELRQRSLSELGRVLTPEGRALVSAWSVSHDRFERDQAFDTEIDWTLPNGETVGRYYHIYDVEEFTADLLAAGLRVIEVTVEAGNCYGIIGCPEQ